MSDRYKPEYGELIEVWTFTGWEPFDWDMYETPLGAVEALDCCSKIRPVQNHILDASKKVNKEEEL